MPSTETNLTIAVIVLGVALFVSICFNLYLLLQLTWRRRPVVHHPVESEDHPSRRKEETPHEYAYATTSRREASITLVDVHTPKDEDLML